MLSLGDVTCRDREGEMHGIKDIVMWDAKIKIKDTPVLSGFSNTSINSFPGLILAVLSLVQHFESMNYYIPRPGEVK